MGRPKKKKKLKSHKRRQGVFAYLPGLYAYNIYGKWLISYFTPYEVKRCIARKKVHAQYVESPDDLLDGMALPEEVKLARDEKHALEIMERANNNRTKKHRLKTYFIDYD